MKNSVYIGVSIDGYISDKNGGLSFLESVPIPEGTDMGYHAFMQGIDALVMGRNSFETVLGFKIDWPYDKHVFVLSNSLTEVPGELQSKVSIVKGELNKVLEEIHTAGYQNLYIDGGVTIQNFLKEDLIDEIILTTIPILTGGGTPLFGEHTNALKFNLVSSKIFADAIVQNHYVRKK